MPGPTQRLIDNLQIRLPGALLGTIQLELFNVVDEFCRDIGAWRDILEVTLTAGQTLYDLASTGATILELFELSHLSLDTTGAVYEAPGQLLLPIPPNAQDASRPLYANVTLAPAGDNTDVENWLPVDMWTAHHGLLLEGTLARMMSQIAKPYSHPQMAVYHGKRFRNAMALVRATQASGGVNGAPTWSYPRFA